MPEVPNQHDEMPLVCVCVITYNGKQFFERCFDTLQKLTDYENYRLVLIDNGSTDGSAEDVDRNFPDVEVERIFPNGGYPHAANEAVNQARRRGAKYVAILNDDIAILHPQWLREAVLHAENDPSIGFVGFDEVTSQNGQHPAPVSTLTDVMYLNGFVMVIPLELFDRIGMFDEVYFTYGEEDDLVARAQAAGYRIVRLGIPIYHLGGATTTKCNMKTRYLQMRNEIRFCLKNRSPLHALLRTARVVDVACNPWSLTFDRHNAAHRNLRYSGTRRVKLVLWLRAVLWNIVRLPQTLRIRAGERRLVRAASISRKRLDTVPGPFQMAPKQGHAD